ncbi:unnamed protein product [Anisakis simplex]|uniref:DUF4201 domain-containing protein n=1 Tax=Anisakis simplex TaxID=6269 RepID=A0A0M3JRY9_ANISI|nr:unnamed protein product [Anisakis simplex]
MERSTTMEQEDNDSAVLDLAASDMDSGKSFELFDGDIVDILMEPIVNSIPTTSRAVLPSDTSEVPSDLNKCRTRIDATVQQQKRNRHVLAALNSQISKYRQKAAQTNAELVAGSTNEERDALQSSNLLTTNSLETNRIEQTNVGIGGATRSLMASNALFNPSVQRHNVDAMQSASSTEVVFEQLMVEQMRSYTLEDMNEMLRDKAQLAVQANASLRQDLLRASEELKRLSDEYNLLYRQSNRKTQLLNVQNDRIRELWSMCNTIKRKMRDLNRETEHDLERQKTEFVRCANNMERAVQQFEFKRQQQQHQQQQHQYENETEDTAFENLLKDYEKIVVRNMKLEHEESENVKKIMQMELSLKRSDDERGTLRDSIKKIHQMPELVEARGRRARSVSPGERLIRAFCVFLHHPNKLVLLYEYFGIIKGRVYFRDVGYISSFDTVRLIRNALQNRDDEMRLMKRNVDDLTEQIENFKRQLSKCEDARRSADELANDLRKQLQNITREKDAIDRAHRHVCQKNERLDAERIEANETVMKLREEIAELNRFANIILDSFVIFSVICMWRTHQTVLDEMLKKQQDEIDKRRREYNDLIDENDRENVSRISKLRNEIENWRLDLEKHKEQLRIALADASTERRRVKDIEIIVEDLRKVEKDQLLEIGELKQTVEKQKLEIIDMEKQHTELNSKITQNDITINKMKSEKDALTAEKLSLTEQIAMLRSELLQKNGLVERLQIIQNESSSKIDELKIQLETYERNAIHAKDSLAELEAKLSAANDHISAIESERLIDKEQLEKCHYDIALLREERNQLTIEFNHLKEEMMTAQSTANNLQKQINVYEETIKSSSLKQVINEETIEELRKTEKKLKGALDEVKLQSDVKLQENHEILKKERDNFKKEFETLQRQLNDESTKTITDLQSRLHMAQTGKNEVERRLVIVKEQLDDRNASYENLKKEFENLKMQFENMQESYEREVDKLKNNLEMIEQQRTVDASAWDDDLQKMRTEMDEAEKKWRKEKNELEVNCQERIMIEEKLNEEIQELNGRYESEREMVNYLRNELDQREEITKGQLETFDNERQQWSLKIRSAESERRRTEADTEIVRSKYAELENSLDDLQKRFTSKVNYCNEMETELNKLKEELKKKGDSESALKVRVEDLQRQLDELSSQRDRLRALVNESTTESTGIITLYICMMALHYKNQLRAEITDKNKQLASLTDSKSELQKVHNSLLRDLESERQKNMEMEANLKRIRIENEKLLRDIRQVQESSTRKVESSKSALEDVVENCRTVARAKSDVMREKDAINNELISLRDRLKKIDEKRIEAECRLSKSETNCQRLQQLLNEYEENARRMLTSAHKADAESRLNNCRQLLLSQEEAVNVKNHELKGFKSRIMTFELHSREKDAKINALNEQIGSLKTELIAMEEEHKSWKASEALWEDERIRLNQLQKRTVEELEKYRSELNALKNINSNLSTQLADSEHASAVAQRQCTELTKAVNDYRKSLLQLQIRSKEQLQGHTHPAATARSSSICTNEIEEIRNRNVNASRKIAELQEEIRKLTTDKACAQDRLNALEKFETDHRTLQGGMRRELELLMADKVRLTNEVDDLKRRLLRTETERRELDANRARLERERCALKSHIETLSQLEKENGGRALVEISTQKRLLEGQLQHLTHEKREVNMTYLLHIGKFYGLFFFLKFSSFNAFIFLKLEQIYEEREKGYMQKMRMFESKIAILHEQLEDERKRRRDFVERAVANERDIGELRLGLDESIASLQRLTIHQTPLKRKRSSSVAIVRTTSNNNRNVSSHNSRQFQQSYHCTTSK